LVIAAALYVLLRVAAILRFVVVPVFLSLVIAALLEPLVGWMSKRMPRLLATWIVMATVAVSLVGLVVVASGPVVRSARELVDRSQAALDRIRSWLRDGPLGLDDGQVDELFDRIAEAGRSAASGLTDNPTSTAIFAAEIVGAFLLSLVVTFFFVKDGPKMWSWLLQRVRDERREPIDSAGRAAVSSLQGWVRGTAITGVADGLIIGTALWILGVPAALSLALFTFFGAFFPIVGATVAGALAAAVALADSGPGTAIIVVIVVLVVQQVEGDLLLPLIMYRQVALHPVVILVALAIGAAIGGIVGALVSVPLTAATTAAISAVRPEMETDAEPGGEAEHGAATDATGATGANDANDATGANEPESSEDGRV
jgi:putative heme transporter